MKSLLKILSRYVLSAAGVALILLVFNFTVLIVWLIQAGSVAQKDYSVSQLAAGLKLENGVYTLSSVTREAIKEHYQWAMLIGDDRGEVLWSLNLPTDVPLHYTLSDTAGFSRWYLNDYPVHVWRLPEGLFVLGSAKGSLWKHNIEEPRQVMDNILVWIPAVLILNGIVAVLLALLFGLRLFQALKPLARGIEDMAENRPVALSARGLLGDLAAGINKTSARLLEQEAALNKRDTARTTWIAGVSHDIRTPLSLVMGYAGQLEEDPELPPSKREQAGVIRSQSQRIKTLVNDLNLASKLEYDMQPIRKTAVSLPALLRSVAAGFLNGRLDPRYSLDVVIGASAHNAMVTADEELLRRAVANLITNSIGHNPQGCAIQVSLESGPDHCTLGVSDDGAGFAPETLNRLNDPPNALELTNHGLGLAIVRQIVKAHGGSTEFRNLATGGCSVLLRLPVSV